jgi:HAD superfamily hydrolase (TIGR01509 family)
MMQARGILFDLDGLLVDSEPLWSEADAAFLAARGVAPGEGLKSLLMGTGQLESSRALKERYGLRESAEEIAAGRLALVDELYRTRLEPRPGVPGVLARFRRSGWRPALATSSPGSLVEVVFTRFPWRDDFQAVASGDEVERGKPAPDLFLLAARRLGLPPPSCLVVEDAPAGVDAARAAGMRCVAVPDPRFHRRDELPADLMLDSLEDLTIEAARDLIEAGPARR